ncbi:hypothetical protein LEP1GSC108_2564 [Leptospira weilii str. UI 13098]|uniref:Uncharacterized protein n=1 Tax=Leptospira weilii str. UI 13098 TaxID=1088542 RepID=M6QL85_9LEPT|nr:hypothetical protein LEP1GSC108_2564 [Leptospira weilii str. UI 13098]
MTNLFRKLEYSSKKSGFPDLTQFLRTAVLLQDRPLILEYHFQASE